MKLSSIIFRDFLINYFDSFLKRQEGVKDKTIDELWRKIPLDEKVSFQELTIITYDDIDWLKMEDWLEHQFREDLTKDFVEVARVCMKEFELSNDMFNMVAMVSGSVRDEVSKSL